MKKTDLIDVIKENVGISKKTPRRLSLLLSTRL